MATNIPAFTSWSTTAGSNQPDSTDAAAIAEDLQKIQAETRKFTATKGADIASATTTDLATATGNYVHITGTTTITGLGTVSAGVRFLLVFDGILTFTHNAASLLLPTGANITTAAGDRCEVVSLGSGNFRCLWYQRASGAPLDAELAAIAGLTSAADKVPRFTGSGTAEVIDVAYGTYTPTFSSLVNLDSVTIVGTWQYIRVGNIVSVSGKVDADATAASSTATSFRATVPVASDFSSNDQAHGAFVTSNISGTVNSASGTQLLSFNWGASTTASARHSFSAHYEIV